eukprot:TRINITY_DN5639_c0_g1_i13.p5 TRINITY_DN5639_c0_g1~~TRINITY_DN5639_c0_g1_i13.p5  ORF type:complete len:121 (+),score=2.54 TRINITY_DN5639_c0_g1_i13:717-1079(+)
MSPSSRPTPAGPCHPKPTALMSHRPRGLHRLAGTKLATTRSGAVATVQRLRTSLAFASVAPDASPSRVANASTLCVGRTLPLCCEASAFVFDTPTSAHRYARHECQRIHVAFMRCMSPSS